MKEKQTVNRIISAYQLLAGVLGFFLTLWLIFLTIPTLSDQPVWAQEFLVVIIFYALIAYALSFFAGLYLWKEKKKGWLLSIINQSLQIPIFTIAGFSYQLTAGLEIPAYFALNSSKEHYFFYLGSRWNISYFAEDPSLFLGVNIVALILLINFILGYRKFKKEA